MTTQVITINEESLDLNLLFSFDLLKRTIEYLVINQKETNQRIHDLESRISGNTYNANKNSGKSFDQ